MPKVPEERRGDQQIKFVPVKADATYQEINVEIEKRETLKEGMEHAIATNFSEKPWPSHLWPDESELEPPPPPQRDFSNQQVTVFMLDCEGLSFQIIDRKLRFACAVVRLPDWSAYTLYTGERWQTGEGGADVILLKNFRKRDPDRGELLGAEWLDAYYHGTLDLGSPGRCLATLVKRRRIAPTRLIEDAGYLGPLWQVVSKKTITCALVCDLWINAGPELPPLRLRLPNCKPGTVVDSRFFLSESDWNIEECDISPDGGKKGTFVTAGVYEPLSMLYDGTRTNCAANGNEDYMLALTLRKANWTEYSPECKARRLKSSWYDDISGRFFVQKQE
ncbi:hypothetical protein BKA63DRAFT_285981 [Paraphoma chrysanthemicola]|nr:hypothetical protein BKA63DRAFT_285981 [Paraphoma chrysanthemicola]